jgi:hypothetical protein
MHYLLLYEAAPGYLERTVVGEWAASPVRPDA